MTITPEASKKINRDVMNKLRTTYGAAEFKGKHGAYDGHKSLFTSGPLNFSNQQEYPVFLHGERLASLKYDSLSQLLNTTSVTVLNKVFLIRQASFVSSARKGSIKRSPKILCNFYLYWKNFVDVNLAVQDDILHARLCFYVQRSLNPRYPVNRLFALSFEMCKDLLDSNT